MMSEHIQSLTMGMSVTEMYSELLYLCEVLLHRYNYRWIESLDEALKRKFVATFIIYCKFSYSVQFPILTLPTQYEFVNHMQSVINKLTDLGFNQAGVHAHTDQHKFDPRFVSLDSISLVYGYRLVLILSIFFVI